MILRVNSCPLNPVRRKPAHSLWLIQPKTFADLCSKCDPTEKSRSSLVLVASKGMRYAVSPSRFEMKRYTEFLALDEMKPNTKMFYEYTNLGFVL